MSNSEFKRVYFLIFCPGTSSKYSYIFNCQLALREKCPYSELYWSVFSRIQTEYGEIPRIFPYSVQMWENTDQNNSVCTA